MEFDESLVRKLVEQITVYDDHFTIEFKSGISIDVKRIRAGAPIMECLLNLTNVHYIFILRSLLYFPFVHMPRDSGKYNHAA